MKKIIITIFLLFVYFSGIVFNQIPQLSFLTVWDEAITLILMMFCVLKLFKNRKIIVNNDFKFIYPWILIVISGLIGNAIYKYAASGQAIIKDIVVFLKFPVCFFALRYLSIDEEIKIAFKTYFLKLLHILVWVISICAVISLFFDIGMTQSNEVRHGIYSFQFLFNHPNSFGIVMVMILCLFNSVDDYNSQKIYILLSIMLLVLTMRTKIIAFCAVFIFIKFGSKWANKFKGLFILGSGILVLATTYEKLTIVTKWTESARMRFWTESFNLLFKCFPIGTGFATFASHISGKYTSLLYSSLNIKEIFDQYGNATATIGDTGYPYYIGQFGFFGLCMLFLSVRALLKIRYDENRDNMAVILFLVYLAIALTGESTLTNAGLECAITLSLLICMNKKDGISLNRMDCE